MSVLVIAEHDNRELKAATGNTLAAAQAFNEDIHVLVAGSGCQAVADAAARYQGVKQVLLADAAHYEHQLAEDIAPLVVSLGKQYSAILAPSSSNGKNLVPRVAALLDVQPLSDVMAIEGANLFVRPIYAGNVIATEQNDEAVKVMTVRTTAFDPVAADQSAASIETLAAQPPSGLSSFVGEELAQSDRPELTSARIVISGGRGLLNGENFQLLYTLADKLGAAVGASRAAVDAGFVANDMQVGQTGKVVAPDLYIAVGISGAIQHLAGMKDSKVIVAINKDADAPIFQVADYGLVADLFDALPELTEKI
jgi:electron transfer flavoprotein alpha subunit